MTHINKKKILAITAAVLIGLLLTGGGFWFGFVSGKKVSRNITVMGVANMGLNSSSSAADFGVFWQAWQDVNNLYLKNPDVSNQDKMYGAINGLSSR